MERKAAAHRGRRFWLSGGIAATLTALAGLALFLFPIACGALKTKNCR